MLLLLAACAGPKADSGVDVSGLLCAGTEDPDGNVVIPTHSTDGCDGGAVSGRFEIDGCPDCEFREDAETEILTLYGENLRKYAECKTVPMAPDGTFVFGEVAPGAYAASITEHLVTGERVSLAVPFEVCSEDVVVNGVAYPDTTY